MTVETEKKRPLIHVHMEKCSGTSVQAFLESRCGKDKVLIYDPRADTLTKASEVALSRTDPRFDLLKYLLAHFPFLPLLYRLRIALLAEKEVQSSRQIDHLDPILEDCQVITGHFYANRFDGFFPNPQLTTVVRDPFERMLSHFYHWKRTRGCCQRGWRIKVPFDPQIKFEDFAFLEKLKDFQTQTLAGKNLGNFIVGTTDQLDTFLSKLSLTLPELAESGDSGLTHDFSVRLNRSPKVRSIVPLHPGFSEEFSKFHQLDYQLYDQAKSRAD